VHAGIALMCPTFASKKASPPLFFVEDEAMHILKFVTQWNVSYFVLDLENWKLCRRNQDMGALYALENMIVHQI
jgi:hypothetical protein